MVKDKRVFGNLILVAACLLVFRWFLPIYRLPMPNAKSADIISELINLSLSLLLVVGALYVAKIIRFLKEEQA